MRMEVVRCLFCNIEKELAHLLRLRVARKGCFVCFCKALECLVGSVLEDGGKTSVYELGGSIFVSVRFDRGGC